MTGAVRSRRFKLRGMGTIGLDGAYAPLSPCYDPHYFSAIEANHLLWLCDSWHVQLLLQCTPSDITLATAITTLVKVHKGKHGAESLMLFLALEVRVTIESNTCRHD